jgi:2-polyprenyl-3-methyl-5-hydroxy-6-metoxy-1,4-benzoquinol methylase
MCPVCGSKKKKTHIGSYIQCHFCQSLFLKNPPTAKNIQKHSEIYADKLLSTNTVELKSIYETRIGELAKYLPKNSKVLDVGCGSGAFLQYIKKAGYRPFAMDISKKIINFMKKKGISGYTDMNKIPQKSFDAITAFDVIEHTTDPIKFIKEIKDKLKTKGVIMITTPNSVGISARMLKDKWWVFKPEGHYILLSPKGIRYLLEKIGFKIIFIKTDIFTQWFPPNNTLFKKIANKLLYLLFSPVKKYLFSHYLGDNIEVIAKL